MSPLSERLILLREQHRLPQRTVAEAIQITMRAYQRYEYGEREPQLSTVIALAIIFHWTNWSLAQRNRRFPRMAKTPYEFHSKRIIFLQEYTKRETVVFWERFCSLCEQGNLKMRRLYE